MPHKKQMKNNGSLYLVAILFLAMYLWSDVAVDSSPGLQKSRKSCAGDCLCTGAKKSSRQWRRYKEPD